MPGFKSIVTDVIRKSDVLLEILDARFIDETRNKKLEFVIKNKRKILIHVINKCDCVDKGYMDEAKKRFENCVFVSAKERLGANLLIQKIKVLAGKKKIKQPIVGVVGYPNVGKSSVINMLKGGGSAKISSEAGYTKAMQYLRISRDIMVIDTPGVIAKDMTDKQDLVLIGAENPSLIKDPDLAVIELIESNPGLIEKKYGVKAQEDKEAVIESIALKFNMKKKGGMPDIERASKMILHDWINGKIKQAINF